MRMTMTPRSDNLICLLMLSEQQLMYIVCVCIFLMMTAKLEQLQMDAQSTVETELKEQLTCRSESSSTNGNRLLLRQSSIVDVVAAAQTTCHDCHSQWAMGAR